MERTSAEPTSLASQSARAFHTSGAGNGYLAAKQSYEDHWRAKIERAVGFIPGVVVAVDVTLSAETIYWERSFERDEPLITSQTGSKRDAA